MKIKKPYYILGGILCLFAAVFVIIAMTHPSLSFPWANWVSYTIFVLYAIYTILVFLMPRFKGASFATCGIVGVQFIALAFIVLSIGRLFEANESNWYLPIGLGLTCVANFTSLALQKRKGKTIKWLTMNKRRTVLLKILGIIFSIWLLLTLIWFAWSREFFSGYCNEMKPNEFSNIITPRYYKNDEQYTYFVKYPDYLSTTGNLAVSVRNDEAGVQAFLIWPTLFGEQEFGLMIADETGSYQIYIDKEGKPIDADYREITEKYSSEIADIVAAANNAWNLQ